MRSRLLLLSAVVFIVVPQSSAAAAQSASDVTSGVLPATSLVQMPRGFSITVEQAITVAETSPVMGVIHRTKHPLGLRVYVAPGSHYEVLFSYRGKAVGDVIVSRDGKLGKTYTGALTTDAYARGHYSALFDSPWVWLPFGLAFLLPFVDLRRRRPGLPQLDLLVLLSFGVSYALFNAAHVDAAIWCFYPPLLYLLARMLALGLRPRAVSQRLDGGLPLRVLAVGLVVLAAVRVALAFGAGQVVDVGYASVIGADAILHGHSLYYASSAHLDSYGPITYLVYVPFDALWPWQHSPHYLAAARVAAVFLDLATTGALLMFGRHQLAGVAGKRLGLLLAWGWAANPFTLLAMIDSTNDSLLALLAVLTLIALGRPRLRGALVGLAAAAKFFPGMLLPMLAVGRGDEGRRRAFTTVTACAIVGLGAVAIFLPPGGIKEFYNHTIGWQFSRTDVFSLWSLHPTLDPVKYLLIGAAVALALGLAVRPRGPRSVAQVSALAAAVTIAVQLPGVHWFYYYIDWFLPLVLIALLAREYEAGTRPHTAVSS